MSTAYGYWKDALAGHSPAPIVDDPQPGFYRSRRKAGAPLPLAIWIEDGKVTGRMGGGDDARELTRDRLNEVWNFACANPVTEEAYRAVAERGEPWPDMDATVSDQLAQSGHNRPPTDPATLLHEQIEAASAGASEYATIASDEALARAQTLRSRLLELSGEADKTRKAEKAPHQAKADAVDDQWMPLVKKAKEFADKIKSAMNAWGTKKHEAAEAQRRAIEAAQRKAMEEGRPAPAPPPVVPAAPAKVKGAAGRAASGTPVKVVKAITDYAACYAYVSEQPEVRDAIMQAAQRLVTAGHTVPGTEVKEEIRY